MPLYSSTENGLDTRSASKAYAIHDFATHVASICCLAIVNHKGQPTLNCGAKIRSALSSRSAIQPLLQSLQTSTVMWKQFGRSYGVPVDDLVSPEGIPHRTTTQWRSPGIMNIIMAIIAVHSTA